MSFSINIYDFHFSSLDCYRAHGAEVCASRAQYLVKQLAVPSDLDICQSCQGGGKKKLNVIGGNSSTVLTIPCSDCQETGQQIVEQYQQSKLGDVVWCKCQESSGGFRAGDGREVFGNDTYLCNDCGMVVQFG